MKSSKGMGLFHVMGLAMTLVAVLPYVSGTSNGALAGACADWTPQHGGNTPQTSASPYSITFTPSTFTANGSSITVTLNTDSGAVFKGFLLTAQYDDSCADQTAMPGSFATIANSKYLCNNGAVTHSTVNSQNSLSFQWTPPATSEGNIHFRATFVRSYAQFWVNVKSNVIVDSAVGAGNSKCTPTQAPPPTGTIQKDPACGQTKGCYSDCSGNDCKFLMTWAPGTVANTVLITMAGKIVTAANRYIGFGLSNDNEMGTDSVHYCINDPNGVYSSYNDGKSSAQLPNPKEGISNIIVNFMDGVLTCMFTRTTAGGSNGRLFALDKEYTLFWAEGPGSSAGAGKHNSIPLISTSAASLQDFTVDIGGGVDFPLVKAHGSLMVAAWICFASIGIVLARYFKNVWEDHKWFGQKIWFQVHRTCMILCMLATVIAFIIIFVEVEGYSEIEGEGYQEAHPVLGIIVTILTVINPIMALFRPHPGTKNRPIFNWLHWAVGFGAYTLAVITVFFGMELDKAGAPDYIIYILVAFVVWQVFVEITLEIIQCRGRNAVSEMKHEPEKPVLEEMPGEGPTDKYEMTDNTQNSSDNKSASQTQSASIKIALLAIHIVVVLAFTITVITVLNAGEDDD